MIFLGITSQRSARGNNDQDCNIKNSLKFIHDCARLCPVLRCYHHKNQVCGTPHPLLVSVGGSTLDDPEISSVLRLCTSSHGIRESRIILLSVCQAPSESSFDKLRLHKLCTSITLRLLLLRDCIKSHGQIQLHTRVLAKLCPHQGYIFVRITIVIATSRQDFFRGHFSTESAT